MPTKESGSAEKSRCVTHASKWRAWGTRGLQPGRRGVCSPGDVGSAAWETLGLQPGEQPGCAGGEAGDEARLHPLGHHEELLEGHVDQHLEKAGRQAGTHAHACVHAHPYSNAKVLHGATRAALAQAASMLQVAWRRHSAPRECVEWPSPDAVHPRRPGHSK